MTTGLLEQATTQTFTNDWTVFLITSKNLYHLKNVQIVKKEGFSSSMSLMDDERIWLGERNFLMVGDAAGLIDPTRGVGMDAAA